MAHLAPVVPWPAPHGAGDATEAAGAACGPVVPSLSDFQASLRAASRRTSPPTSTPGRCFVPQRRSHEQENATDAPVALEELSWSGREVVWSRAGTVFRSFSFDEHEQDVTQALFVELNIPAPESVDAAAASSQASTSAVRLDETASSVFGPYRRPAPSAWSDDPLPLPREPPASSSSPTPQAPTRARTLLILLSTLAFAYPVQEGGSIPFPLPFRVSRAWPLAGSGVLLERASATGSEVSGAAWFSLSGPFDEFRPVSVTRDAATEPAPSTSVPLSDMDERVVFLSSPALPLNAPAALVSTNTREGKVRVWQYARVDPGALGVEDAVGSAGADILADLPADVKGKGKARESMNESATDEGGAVPTHDSVAMDRSRTSLSGTKRKHGGAGAPGDELDGTSSFSYGSSSRADERSVRRASAGGQGGNRPRTSTGGLGASGLSRVLDGQDELLEALGHSAEPLVGAHAGVSRRPGITVADRRTSMTRNELSVTMDRMVLSQSQAVGGGLGAAGLDMDREATVLLGEGDGPGEAKSEIVLQQVWEAELGNLRTDGMAAWLFDSRTATSSTLAIHLPSAQVLLLVQLTFAQDGTLSVAPMRELQVVSATPVVATRPNVFDLLYLRPDRSLALITAEGREVNVPSPKLPDGRVIRSLDGDFSAVVAFTLDNGSRLLTRLDPPARGLAGQCLRALGLVLELDSFDELLRAVTARQASEDPLAVLEEVLHELFGLQKAEKPVDPFAAMLGRAAHVAPSPSFSHLRSSAKSDRPPRVIPLDSPLSPQQDAILRALHLVAQDARLVTATQHDFVSTGKLVARLAGACGLLGWVDYYRRLLGPALGDTFVANVARPTHLPWTPPDLFFHLASILANKPSSLSVDFGSTSSAYFGSGPPPNLRTKQLISLFTSLSSPSSGSTTIMRAHGTVLAMHTEHGWSASTLAELSFGAALPLREAVRMCQLDAPEGWPKAAYELIGRPDLARQVDAAAATPVRGETVPAGRTAVPSIDSLVRDVTSEEQDSRALRGGGELSRPSARAARFNEDKRLEEVARMLQFEQPAVVSAGERTLDQLTPQIQQSVLLALSQRTLALPIGQGMFRYRTKVSLPSDSIAIPRIDTSARIIPMSSPVPLADKEPRDPNNPAIPDRMEWPEFHAGAAAALRLRFDTRAVDSSQISFNRPGDLDSRHAGMLLGLGLTGQLGNMLSSQAYEYLKAKHDPTSLGVLLGLAVSYLGTSDPTVTSVVSIHLPALHPPRSSTLNVSGMAQAAAAVSLGLLHFGTGRRTYADVLMREMCSITVSAVEDASLCREAYTLSCGFAHGMIMLGKGRDLSVKDVDHLRTFRLLILGEGSGSLPGSHSHTSSIDVSITSPAATVALMLMYLRSERKDVADVFEIPSSARNLDYVRNDLLLLRVIGRNLVRWKKIAKTKEWVEAEVPPFLNEAVRDGKAPIDPDLEIARWTIIAGACFAMSLKYAGTAAAEAHATLIHYLDRLTRATYLKTSTVQGKIKRHALRNTLGVVALSLSMVMAGTGEINVLRRLRVAHGLFSEGVTYGSHLATHMALGLLFLGQGQYTLGNSDAAVAALLLALYPALPATATENRAHLQAYRHLWVLAVEPRYLEARDVDTHEPVFLPVRLRLAAEPDQLVGAKPEVRAKQLVAPTLLPNLRLIDTIQIDSPRYWTFSLRLSANATHLARFLTDSTLHVKRRTGHLSYAQDPRGIRSIFTRSKSETGSAVLDFGETARMLVPSVASSSSSSVNGSSSLRDFVQAFSGDAEAIALTQALCRSPDAMPGPPSAFEAFAASVLLECLTKDKRDVAQVYHTMHEAYRAVEAFSRGGDGPLALIQAADIRFVVDFYRRGTFKTLFSKPASTSSSSSKSSTSSGGSVSREPLLHPAFIDHVASSLSALGTAALDVCADELRAYLAAPAAAAPGALERDKAAALALAQQHLHLPSLEALLQLQSLVRSAMNDEGRSADEVALLVRRTRKGIEERRGRGAAWSGEAEDWMLACWTAR
ncbi:hypothetical protein Rhopal_006813-T1 [Rhodotorula paludigena]|uniref:Anaphase-promoting complex subunit 1 n=1 Tax=Rhodotorula paludigena TaxID=86838 RepID=A0AAV5GN58_9BASI|nr:hypothetical protein Rhopal_006813-T1 [Rhodotorula paludigena]